MTAASNVSASPRPLVLLDTLTTAVLADRIAALEARGAVLEFVDYSRLASAVPRLQRVLREHELDFVLFARNDQVYDKRAIGVLIRALKVGYSSFSGIDTEEALSQTRTCLDDYLGGGRSLGVRSASREKAPPVGGGGTFSLLFDLEQLGGARFGLPRILDVLDEFEVPATFFTTSFVGEVYRDVFDVLARHSHEVGLHGLYHEYLAGRGLEDQLAMIAGMRTACGNGISVSGANFIGRMDDVTVEALVSNGLEYFVVFMEHRYAPFAYRRMPLRPMRVAAEGGAMWMIPVNVETNNRPWGFVKRLVDAAVSAGEEEGWRHVNVLLHPFRDGTLRHIGDLRRLVRYLRMTLGYEPARLGDVVAGLPVDPPETFVYYELGRNGEVEAPPIRPRHVRRWWGDRSRYEERVGSVYRALAAEGRGPALAVGSAHGAPPAAPTFAIYPHLPSTETQPKAVELDPLDLHVPALRDAVVRSTATRNGSCQVFMPKSLASDLITATRASRPRRRHDYAGLLPEAALRVAYRLTRGRHVF